MLGKKVLGKNINLFLMDGITNGRIKYSYSNWTGLVYKIPRLMLGNCKNVVELKGSGVYFLFGQDDESGQDFMYIGQANLRKKGKGILNRVKEHIEAKETDFWHTAIMVVKKDSSLGATEISYLENRFYNIAKEVNDESGRYIILNGNEPNVGNVTEETASEMEHFIRDVLIAVGVLGYKSFTELVSKPKLEDTNLEKQEDSLLEDTFYLRSAKPRGSAKPYDGTMVNTLEGIVLLKGSLVNPNVSKKASPKYIDDKIKNRVYLDENNRTTKDLLFNSPTGAAVFVVGYSISGPKNWKNKDGLTMEKLKI